MCWQQCTTNLLRPNRSSDHPLISHTHTRPPPSPRNSLRSTQPFGIEGKGYAKRVDTDTDTIASTATDDVTTVFWSSCSDNGGCTATNSSNSDPSEILEAGTAIAHAQLPMAETTEALARNGETSVPFPPPPSSPEPALPHISAIMRVTTPSTFFAVSSGGMGSPAFKARAKGLGNAKYMEDLNKAATALEWTERLDEFVSEEGMGAIRKTMMESGVRWAKSNPGTTTNDIGARKAGWRRGGSVGDVSGPGERDNDKEPNLARSKSSSATAADLDIGRRGDQEGRRRGRKGGQDGRGDSGSPRTHDKSPHREHPRVSSVTKMLSPARPTVGEVSPCLRFLDGGDDDGRAYQEKKKPAPPVQQPMERVGARGRVDGGGSNLGVSLPPVTFPLSLRSTSPSETLRRSTNSSTVPSSATRNATAARATSTGHSKAQEVPVRTSENFEEHNTGGADETAVRMEEAVRYNDRTAGVAKEMPAEEVLAASDVSLSSSLPSPSVWVTRYLDYWSAYGLVFVLSNGSVGLLFKDDTKMVLDPSGTIFDYSDPSSCSDYEAKQGSEGSNSRDNLQASNSTTRAQRYTLDYCPLYLKKKRDICRYFRQHLLPDDGRGGGESRLEGSVDQQHPQDPLVFLDRWRCAGDTHCFELSDQTLQVGKIERQRGFMTSTKLHAKLYPTVTARSSFVLVLCCSASPVAATQTLFRFTPASGLWCDLIFLRTTV